MRAAFHPPASIVSVVLAPRTVISEASPTRPECPGDLARDAGLGHRTSGWAPPTKLKLSAPRVGLNAFPQLPRHALAFLDLLGSHQLGYFVTP